MAIGPSGLTKSRCVYGASILSWPYALRKSWGIITPAEPSKHIRRIVFETRCQRWIIDFGIQT